MMGTNPYPFTRLMDKVIEISQDTDEQFIVQSGNTPVQTDKIEDYPFMAHSKILKLMSQADIVITQGGFGSLQDCMQQGVKTIAVPRLIEKGESMDDQTEIVNALATENLVIPVLDINNLGYAIEKAKNLEVCVNTSYKLQEHIVNTVSGFLER